MGSLGVAVVGRAGVGWVKGRYRLPASAADRAHRGALSAGRLFATTSSHDIKD
jgi:hypothetical protein